MVLTGFKTPHGVASLANITDNFSLFPNWWSELCHGLSDGFLCLPHDWVYRGNNFWNQKSTSGLAKSRLRKFLCVSPFFYGGALLAIMAIIPWRELASADSPFVTVFELAGIKWAAALINFVVLTSAASALNSTLYSTGSSFVPDCPWFTKSLPKSN